MAAVRILAASTAAANIDRMKTCARRLRPAWARIGALIATLCLAPIARADSPYPANLKNTQNPKDVPLTPETAWRTAMVPPGFHITLFAAERLAP